MPHGGGHGSGVAFSARLLQSNINHSRRAQDLLVQTMRELGVGLAVVAEPYAVPVTPPNTWLGDARGSVAIVGGGAQGSPVTALIERGDGFVAVQWGDVAVVGVYASPSMRAPAFCAFLDGVAACVARCLPRPVLVLGDFNAHATAWGSPRTNARGDAVLGWAAGLDLRLVNRGSAATCVRWQGTSIVDLSWATPAAVRRVKRWRVAEGLETLSDHLHIIMEVAATGGPAASRRPGVGAVSLPPRWALGRINKDALAAALHAVAWSGARPSGPCTAEGESVWFRGALKAVCDAAMPRATPPRGRAVYWWSREIAGMRETCVRARRRYTRARRRRRRGEESAALLYGEYREARVALQRAIAVAKTRAWRELLGTLDRDPWGRPYRIVMGKMRPWAPPLTETMEPRLLRGVLDALFPAAGVEEDTSRSASGLADPTDWSAGLGVTEGELASAVRKMTTRNTAPGPDGVPGRVLAWAVPFLGDRLRRAFDACLRSGEFPSSWRRGKLVLLRKEGRPAEDPSAYRPICLLDEIGKMLERIVASRVAEHLSEVGPDLDESQFGFRRGRSTLDAITRVRSLAGAAMARGGVALAVSLDIVNAFNSLPWAVIRGALRYHRLPPYLRRLLGSYLSGRLIEYPGRDGVGERLVGCGVPQGSVLGPLLWDLAYDSVLRVALPPGVSVTCYADDTLVLASGQDYRRTARLAELGVACVVSGLERLGLRIAPHKTEAMWMVDRLRRGEPPATGLCIGQSCVGVGQRMRYLGLTLDTRWSFEAHFERLAPRLEGVAAALGRILPNLGGPAAEVRRLYAGVVRSIALYGAPVWSGDLVASRRSLIVLRRVERRVAIRVARAYRTISYEAAMTLAGLLPLDIQAGVAAADYASARASAAGDPRGHEGRVRASRLRSRRRAVAEWKSRLAGSTGVGRRVVGAVLPSLEKWLGRSWGRLTYRMTQVLSGHGCFGEYLLRIRKEETAQCWHCEEAEDTAQHTLEECPAWAAQRRVLRRAVGHDLSLPTVVETILRDRAAWDALALFCEVVMLQKEEAERVRERSDPARGGGGIGRRGRRRQQASAPPD